MPVSVVTIDDGGDAEAGVEEVNVAGCGGGGAEVEWPSEASLHRHHSSVCRARYPSYTSTHNTTCHQGTDTNGAPAKFGKLTVS